ncbi:MAG TPA: signal recognition particle protein Srp54 [Candidatus Nanoarchaeia archaeon]|nr:signal recognition particle protein Srp54 [Candidatus Nanoarchaeia archaeon]
MVLDKLSKSLKETLSKIAKSMFVDEKLINELVKDIQRALLASDVNVKLVFDLSKSIKERALQEKPPQGITQKEHLVKIVYEELVKFMGGESSKLELTEKPFKIMMVGLFGSGKTTTIGKLAKYYLKRGNKVCSIGLDVYRPAAMDQLEQVSKQINIPCFIDKKEKNPIKIYKNFEKELNKFDLILIDTSGRDALSKDLIKEIEDLNKTIKPQEKLLVLSADIGQAAQTQAKSFHEACNITGIVVTKLDGTARGGGAISACSVSGAPIKFIGLGEKADDLETFNPKGFVSRILGMGDIEALLEKTKEVISEEEAQDMSKKLIKGDFNFLDLYDQMEKMSSMGSLSKIMELIPGLSKANIPKEMLEGQEDKMKKWKYILQSCTKKELEDPELLDSSRIQRIAEGSGTTVQDVRSLLKQYKQSKKTMKMMKGLSGDEKDMEKLMKKFKGKMPKGMGF